MKCPQCSYSLWGLPPGPCPECGLTFDPTAFHFVRGSVLFLCPSCGQKYKGNDEHGIPAPRTFECATCHDMVEASRMRVEPAPGMDPDRCEDLQHPWLDRGDRPIARAALSTWWKMATAPAHTIGALRGRPSLGAASAYVALLAGVIVVAATAVVVIWLVAATGSFNSSTVVWEIVEGAKVGAIAIGVAAVALTIWILLAHAMIRAFAGRGGPPRTLRVTAECLLWSCGGFVLGVVPVIGACSVVLGAAWVAFTAAKSLQHAHRITWWRAARATVVPVVALMVMGCVGFAVVVSMAMSAIGSFQSAAATVGPSAPAVSLDPEQLPPPETESQPEGDSADDQFRTEPDPDPGQAPPEGKPEEPGQR